MMEGSSIASVAILAQALAPHPFCPLSCSRRLHEWRPDGCGLIWLRAATVAMPHRHSEKSISSRRQRASERGYLRPNSSNNHFIEVPTELVDRVKAVAKSMTIHSQHCNLAGRSIHYAAAAAQ